MAKKYNTQSTASLTITIPGPEAADSERRRFVRDMSSCEHVYSPMYYTHSKVLNDFFEYRNGAFTSEMTHC